MAACQFMKSHLTAPDSDVSQHAQIQEGSYRSEEGRHLITTPAASVKLVEFVWVEKKNSPRINRNSPGNVLIHNFFYILLPVLSRA